MCKENTRRNIENACKKARVLGYISIYVVGLLAEFRRTADASVAVHIAWLGVPTTTKNTLLFMWAGFLTTSYGSLLVSSYLVECVFGTIAELEYE